MGSLRGIAALVAVLASGTPAGAALFIVNNTGDGVANPTNCGVFDRDSPPDLGTLPTSCRLRDAVARANALAGADEIVINLGGDLTITLLETLEVTESLDINAPPLTGQQIFTSLVLVGAPSVDDLLRVTDGETELGGLRLTLADIDIAGATSNLVFDTPTNATFAETISGAGALEKSGSATLTLTGTNDFTGDIVVSAGTLQGDTLSLPGNDVQIQTGARLVFDQATDDPEDFAGVITGPGTLEKTGQGTLDLTAANTFTGTITVTQGTLKGFVAPGGSSLNGNIVNNAKLVFVQAVAGSFDDNISGSGNVEKTGPGDLTLDGTNSFSGGLTISEGKVIGDAASIPGNVSLAAVAGTQVVFDQGTTAGTHAGSITGGTAGGVSLVKRGTGKLTLTGNNSFLGDTSVEAGELEGSTSSLPGNIALGAGTTISFNQTGNGTYDDVISGTGALVKRGGGSLSLIRSQTFVGNTTLEAGTLVVGVSGQGDGSGTQLPGNVSIQSGGTLAGIGQVAGNVTANGTVSPAGSGTGTLQVGGIDFGASSVLAVNVADAGSDLLQVNGTATIANGARLDLTLGSVQLVESTKEVLTSEGAKPANLFQIEQEFAFFDTEVVFLDTNDIGVHFTPNGNTPATLAQTPNQRAVAAALEQAIAAPMHDPDLDTVAGAILGLPTTDLPQALDDMAGEQLTEFATARLAIADRMQTSLQERIRGVAWNDAEGLISQQDPSRTPVIAGDPVIGRMLPGIAQGGPWPVAVAGQSMSSILDSADSFGPAPGELGLGGWIDGYGLFGTLEGESGSKDLDYLIGGFSLGVDYRLHENWLIGAAGGYAHTELDFDELSGDQSAETGQGALYAGYVHPWLQIGASGRFGYSAMSASRDIDFIGRNTDADFDGWDAGARAEAALDLFEVRGVEIQPLAAISYTHVQQDEIDESGADSLNLTADEEEVDSILSGLGARVHGVIRIDTALWLHPELRARWNHEFGDTDRQLSARIGGEPGAVFSVDGAEVPADSGVIGVSWTLVSAGRLHAFIDYDVTLASELLQHGVAVGAKVVW